MVRIALEPGPVHVKVHVNAVKVLVPAGVTGVGGRRKGDSAWVLLVAAVVALWVSFATTLDGNSTLASTIILL